MRKMIALLLGLALALSLCACGKSAQPEEKDPADVSAEASSSSSAVVEEEFNVPAGYEFKAAFAQDNAPYSFTDENGELVGVDVDIARAMCERLGWTLNAQGIDWNDPAVRSEKLSSGDVDCIWGTLPFREINESDTLWNGYASIYVDATVLDGAGYNKLADLKGKTIEVEPSAMFALEGDRATELGRQLKEDAGKVEQVSDAQAAYQDLADGKCDAIVVSGAVDDQVVLDNFDVSFMAVYDVDAYNVSDDSSDGEPAGMEYNSICDMEMGAGFAADDDVYYAATRTIDALIGDGTIGSILNDWAGKDNGTYADAVSCCGVFQVEQFDSSELEELLEDSSMGWDELEDWDGEESVPDESMEDITVEADASVTTVK